MEITLKKRSLMSFLSVLWLTPKKRENNPLETKISTQINHFKNKKTIEVIGYSNDRFENKI